jgi:uncharacterized protein (TIGR00159 family)
MAMNIFIGIVAIYLLAVIVDILHMQLLGSILNQVLSLGLIALVILFQQEIRRFLLMLGTQYLSRYKQTIEKLFSAHPEERIALVKIEAIARACDRFSQSKTGALIVIVRESGLQMILESGVPINADTTTELLESIFYKNSALHDGAVLIQNDKVLAARCILPISENPGLPIKYGTRHRSAIGVTEQTDAISIVVSEETGRISIVTDGKLQGNLNRNELILALEKELTPQPATSGPR